MRQVLLEKSAKQLKHTYHIIRKKHLDTKKLIKKFSEMEAKKKKL